MPGMSPGHASSLPVLFLLLLLLLFSFDRRSGRPCLRTFGYGHFPRPPVDAQRGQGTAWDTATAAAPAPVMGQGI